MTDHRERLPNDRLVEELSAYIDGALEPARADEVRRLIEDNAAVRAEYEELRETVGMLHGLAPVRAPAELLPGVRAKLPRGRRLALPIWLNAKVVGLASAAAAAVLVGVSLQSEQPTEFETTAEATEAEMADSGAGDRRARDTSRRKGSVDDFVEGASDADTRFKKAGERRETEGLESEGLGGAKPEAEEQTVQAEARSGPPAPSQKPASRDASKKAGRKRAQPAGSLGKSAPGKKVAADEALAGASLGAPKDAAEPGALADGVAKAEADLVARFVQTRSFANAGARVSYLERVASMSRADVRKHLVALQIDLTAISKAGAKPAAADAAASPAPNADKAKRGTGGKRAAGLAAPVPGGAVVLADAREARALQTVLSRLFDSTAAAPRQIRALGEQAQTFASAKGKEPALESVRVTVRTSQAELSRFLAWAGSLGLTSTPEAAALLRLKELDGDKGAGAAAPDAAQAPGPAGVAGGSKMDRTAARSKNSEVPTLTVTLVYPKNAAPVNPAGK
ncbi:MAG: hypothetical protein V3T86_17355 [Planctomycetota bacterium]